MGKKENDFEKNSLSFIKAYIKEHQKTFQSEADPRDFIDVYLNEIKKAGPHSSFYKQEGINNLVFTMLDLFIAGTETTSTTLSWAFLLLALNPEKQERVNKEITTVVSTSRLPSLTDRQNMPYTEATILEVMRYSAVVPLGIFHAVLEDTKFNGYDIPKNTVIVANLYCAMRDPEIWGDPDIFRPERFLSPDGETVISHEAFLPFSTGKRVCLGETFARDELFLFISSLFLRFRVATDPNGPKPTLEYHTSNTLTPMPHHLVVYDRCE